MNFGIRINAAGRHEVYQTEDEIRRTPIRDFAKPREAIAFAAMRDLRVSPLRREPDDAPHVGLSAERLTALSPATE